ncbi:MAG: hypothetical protein F4W95_14425 [Chloroflexi bacterium]|nr:hypothetical protein [Chloroflexota bacterium]MYD49657.1 hypothetical protein [Chloroflexota bacterium]
MQPISYPSSYAALPALSVPDLSEIARVEEIKRALVRKAGIQPGTYSTIAPGLYTPIEGVFNGLMDALLSELSGVDAFDLCIRLYERNEIFLGNIAKSHLDRAARQSVSGIAEPSMPIQLLLERSSPYTESIRWLIEIAVKFCETPGERVPARKFDRLVELARAVGEWDMIWEHIHRNVIPHEITVGSDFTVTPQTTPRADKMLQAYRTALAPNTAEWEREEFERLQNRNPATSPEETIEMMESMGLDSALTLEQGYGMSDWAKFSFGLIDSFAADEYRKVIKFASLESFLSRKWNLASDRLPSLLRDFGLSKETVGPIDIKHLRPAEFGRRDSRLLRRPVVVLNRGDSMHCLYGVETVDRGSRMILNRFEYGRIDLIRQSKNKAIRSVVGSLQIEKGKIFEQNIAEECRSKGYQCQPEKYRTKDIRIPQGEGFGPVDVFVVDRSHKRFVLIETKNVMDEGAVPKEMAKEKAEFAGYISKLNAQVGWFTERLNVLQAEYDVSDDGIYSVEGVIVVNNPRMWMFTYDEPVPILDAVNFFRRLAEGSKFTIDPVAPG